MGAGILTRTPWFKANEHKPVHIGMYICRTIREFHTGPRKRVETWYWRYWDGVHWHYGLECKRINTPFSFEGLGVTCPDLSLPEFHKLMSFTRMTDGNGDFEWCGINESPEMQVRYG